MGQQQGSGAGRVVGNFDPLSEIPGIGADVVAQMRALGIISSGDLLARAGRPAGRAEVVAATGIAEDDLLHWLYRIDLERVNGIGWARAEWLTSLDILTVPDLASRNVEELHPRIVELCRARGMIALSRNEVGAWITHAGTLAQAIFFSAPVTTQHGFAIAGTSSGREIDNTSDLRAIPGFPAVMAAGLAGMGVMTVTDLLNRAGQPGPRAELAAASGSSEDALLHWLYQIDLERVHGIGWVRAEWLTGMGVTNAADMARRSAADLQPRIADICRAQGTIAPSEKEVAAWIGHAGTLPQVVYLADDDAASASATLAGGAADAATTLRDDGAVAGRAGLAAGGLVGAGLLTASGYRYDWTQLGFTEKTLADIPAIPDAFVGQLAGAGVTTSPQLLLRGAYPADRAQLAADSGLSADEILHWMYQVDLERVHGIGWSRAAWLRDIDVTTVPDLASRDSAMLYPLVEANFAQRRMQPPARTEVASWISAAKTHEPALFFGEPAGWSYIPAADRTLAGGALLPGAGRAAGGTNLAPATADSTLASAALLGGGALVGGALPGAADGALNTDVAPLDAADDLARGAVDVSVNSAPVADATALTGPADDFALGATDVGANSAPVTGDAALASAALLGGGALAGGALPGAADDNDVVRNREVLAADADPAALPNDAGRAAVYETPPIDDTPVISNLRPGAQVPPAATSVPAPATPVPAVAAPPVGVATGAAAIPAAAAPIAAVPAAAQFAAVAPVAVAPVAAGVAGAAPIAAAPAAAAAGIAGPLNWIIPAGALAAMLVGFLGFAFGGAAANSNRSVAAAPTSTTLVLPTVARAAVLPIVVPPTATVAVTASRRRRR